MKKRKSFEEKVTRELGGYKFNNPLLLRQAFVRRSYTEENGGENNETLEFIGDKALDIAVVRYLIKKYGNQPTRKLNQFEYRTYSDFMNPYAKEAFCCQYDEGQLTRMKQKLVQKETLAQRIDDLGLADFLLMGKGDIKNNRNNEKSVKEDLFEAIIGAVTLDCDWNLEIIQEVVEILLSPESYLDDDEVDYVGAIYDWAANKIDDVPQFEYVTETFGKFVSTYQTMTRKYIYQKINGGNLNWIKFHCYVKFDEFPYVYVGYGKSKNEARKAACKVAYDHLEQEGLLFSIKDEIENPSEDMAINQLETLARRGYFPLPEYDYIETHDADGNPVWNVRCYIDEFGYYETVASSKKQAKKMAAYDMLLDVLENYEEE